MKKKTNIVFQEVEMETYANVFSYTDKNILLFFANVNIKQVDELIRALKELKSKLNFKGEKE